MDVVTGAGVPEARLRHLVATGRWRRVLPRVYATSPAPLAFAEQVRAALLYAGQPAAASHRTGLALWGAAEPAGPVHLTVPHRRRVRSIGFVVVHRSRGWHDDDVRRRRGLPVLGLEACLAGECALLRSPPEVRDLVAAVVQSGRTTPARIAATLGRGRKAALLRSVLAGVADGEHSALEHELAALLRRAGLPRPRRQHPVRTADGRLCRLDLAYPRLRLGIEADGAQWHLSPAAWAADLARQNALVAAGWALLRFPAAEVRGHPERVVALVAAELRRRAA